MSGITPFRPDTNLFNSQEDLSSRDTLQREVIFNSEIPNDTYENSTPSAEVRIPGSRTGRFVNLDRLKRPRIKGRRLKMSPIGPVRERAIQAHIQRYRDDHEGVDPPPEFEASLRADPDPRMKTLAELVFDFRELHGVNPPEETMEEWIARGAVPRGYVHTTVRYRR